MHDFDFMIYMAFTLLYLSCNLELQGLTREDMLSFLYGRWSMSAPQTNRDRSSASPSSSFAW